VLSIGQSFNTTGNLMRPTMTNSQHKRQPIKADGAAPAVSVILLTYNRADLLDAAIESILSQTMADFELIIADNASADRTSQVCQKWAAIDSRIHYYRRPTNVGRTQNMNLGILASVGEYVAILHDDDVYDLDLLTEWKGLLDKYPDAAFVFNAYRALDAQGETRTVHRAPLPLCSPGSAFLEGILFKRWRFDSPVRGTVMMRRRAIDQVGRFNERFESWSDVDMWMRLAEDFDVCYTDKPLITVRDAEVAPHQFADSIGHVQPLLERMFWDARMRHYHARPIRRFNEAIRHWSFVAAARAWHFACAVNRKLRSMRRSESICL